MGRLLTDSEAMRTQKAVEFVEGQPGYQLPPRPNRHLGLGNAAGSGGGGAAGGNCGCQFLDFGTIDCLGIADSPETYTVSLGPFGVVELNHDTGCTWISEEIDYSCDE